MDKFDFEKRKILITGASSGVGRETAIRLSQCGAKLLLVARREDKLRETISLLSGEGHSYKVVDVSEFNTFVKFMKNSVKDDGLKFDGAVHAAGIVEPRPFRLVNEKHLSENFGVHFEAFVAILMLASSKKYFNKDSSIVALSSSHTLTGQKSNSIYTAAKAAVNNLAMSAAAELRDNNIRVNTICAAGIKTEMLTKLVLNNAETLSQLPNDLLEPSEVANAIVALMSDSMRYVSGVCLNIGFTTQTVNIRKYEV